MVSRDLCPSRPNTGGTYLYPYYFQRGKVLTSRPTLVGRLLLLLWLVYREYPPCAGRSPFTEQCIHSGLCGCRYRACGCGVTTRGHEGSSTSPLHAPLGRYLFKVPDAFAPHHVLTRLKVVEQPFQRVRPAGPPLGKKPVYKAPLTAILTAAAQLLAESFRLLPLVGCMTRLLRAWPHAFLWARRCPPSKHPLGCWVSCVQCRCCVVSCCCLCAPSSFLIRAWERQWRS